MPRESEGDALFSFVLQHIHQLSLSTVTNTSWQFRILAKGLSLDVVHAS